MIARVKPQIALDELLTLLLEKSAPPANSVAVFEKQFAHRIGAKEAFAVNSGRLALFLGLQALGIKPGDEIILPSFICNAVVDPILQVGAVPVLVDSNCDDFAIALESVGKAITERCKAILVAHLFGTAAEIGPIRKLAREKGCFLIEDCAHCLDVRLDNQHVGTLGDLGFFSFSVDKPITTGSGGVVLSMDRDISSRLNQLYSQLKPASLADERSELIGLLLQSWLMDKKRYTRFLSFEYGRDLLRYLPGFNKKVESTLTAGALESIKNELVRLQTPPLIFRLLRAAGRKMNPGREQPKTRFNLLRGKFAQTQLENLASLSDIRDKNALWLTEGIRTLNHFRIARPVQNSEPKLIRLTVFYSGCYPTKAIAQRGRELGIEIDLFNWPTPIHQLQSYQSKTRFNKTDLGNCELLAKRLIQLPIHADISDTERHNMLQLLREFDSLELPDDKKTLIHS